MNQTSSTPPRAKPAPGMLSMQIKCNNRKPFLDSLTVQDGWNADGTRNMIEIANVMSKSCRFDSRVDHPECAGCKWRAADDPRDQ